MAWWGWVARRVQVLLRKNTAEMELDDEIRFHLKMEIEQHVASGLSPAEARRRALVAFGGVDRFKEEVRDVRGARVLDDLIQDARVALRSFPKQPAFLLAVLLTLGIGIGGNVAMFAVLDASVFSALPYQAPDRLVLGRGTFNDGAQLGPMVSGTDFYDYRDATTTLRSLGAIAPFPQRVTVTGGPDAERIDGVWVSSNFFQALGVEPLAGRHFRPDEGEAGAADVVVLSQGYWQRSFASDPSVIGSALTLNGVAHTVVGVMPPNARFWVDAEVWFSVRRGEGWARSRSAHNFLLVGRLAEGATLESAQSEMDGISARLQSAYPDSNSGKGLVVTRLRDTMIEPYRSTMALLLGAVVLLLVVACANVAGLLMARGNARKSEMAVRSVMGAGRGRLARQLLTESGILAVSAGVAGVLLAVWIERGVVSYVSMERLGALEDGLSLTSVLFALALSLVTVLLFGALPAARVASSDAAVDLRGAGRVAGSRSDARLRSALVVAQVAFTAVLLSVSGLLVRSLGELRAVDLGFNAEALLTAEVDLPTGRYATDERAVFFEELERRIAGLPGVVSVTLASQLPVRDPGNNWMVGLPGEVGTASSPGVLAHQRVVVPGYFDAMSIPLLAGRDVDSSDRSGGLPPVVLSESAAERIFRGRSPLGQVVALESSLEPRPFEVVGIVADVVLDAPQSGKSPAVYFSLHRDPPTRMRLAIRHRDDAAGLATKVREVVGAMDPDVPLDGVASMDAVLRRYTADQSALAVLVGVFAGVALLLAAVGLYGVLAYQVSRRSKEVGIRMALGASVASVTRSVVQGGLRMVAGGLLVGIPTALLAGRLVEGMLFGVRGADPLTYAVVTVFLGGIGALACLLPARRAARVSPVEAFRSQ